MSLPEIKSKLEQLKNEEQVLKCVEDDTVKLLQAKKAEGFDSVERMEILSSDKKIIADKIDKQKRATESFENRRLSLPRFSSVRQLDDAINGLRYQIQHHTLPLKEETQLVQRINNLEKLRKELSAKETLNHLRYEERAIPARIKEETEKIKALREHIQILNNKLQDICKQRQELSDSLKRVEAMLSNAETDIKEEEAMIFNAETEIKEAETDTDTKEEAETEKAMLSNAETEIKEAETDTDIKEEAETEKAMLSNAETEIKEEEAMISNAETEIKEAETDIKEEATEIKEEAETDVEEEAETPLLAAIEEDKLIFQAMKALYDVILKKIADSHSQSAPEENLVPDEATVAMYQVLQMLVKLSDILNGEEKETIPEPEQPIPEPIQPWVYVVLCLIPFSWLAYVW